MENQNCKQSLHLSGDAAAKAQLMRVCMDCKLSLHVNLVYKELRGTDEKSSRRVAE